MASEVINVIMTALQQVFTGLGSSILTLWNTIVYEYDAGVDTILGTADDVAVGLTPFAEWTLVFLGFSIGVGILYMVLRKVL